MSIRVTVEDGGKGAELLAKLEAALTPEAIDPVIEQVAAETFAHLVEATPKKWFGAVRAAWQMTTPALGERLLINRNKVMKFLEYGTAGGGTGFIYPKQAKFLFIPLTKQAAGGWHDGLKPGVDFILKKKVRGISPRGIVAKEKVLMQQRLLTAGKAHIKKALES